MARRSAALAAACSALFALPQPANAAPTPVAAWYMYGTTPSGLQSSAYGHGCSFAQHHPGGSRVLLLDFGAARKLDASTWGALDFSGVRFANADILAALKAAADGHHNCYARGDTVVTYGNTNYHLSSSGMTLSDAYNVGYYQSSKGYNRQGADAASDMELSWDGPLITKQLVNGDTAHGWAVYYDYGDAAGCPWSGSGGSCNNGWSVGDVGYVSYHGLAVPLPEIYYTVNADQWTVVRRWWNANNPSTAYQFWGTTGEISSASGHLTPAGGWNALSSRNPGMVANEAVCFGC